MSGYIRNLEVIDEDSGEVVLRRETKGSQLGKGWVVMYTDEVTKFLIQCPSAATIKIFLLLANGQRYEGGMITTKKAVQDKVGVTKQTCLASFNYLKEKMVINECKIDGHTEFMINPNYIMVGKDKKARLKEWERRWNSQGKITTLPERKKVRSIS